MNDKELNKHKIVKFSNMRGFRWDIKIFKISLDKKKILNILLLYKNKNFSGGDKK